ncbi:MAG TPA: tripartite tricarboxylate transporter substrate binding protein [Steroidobacteraceae bacterium]|jgi:tripartite-type tricarboxylate transporter receptor subunit TctC|nr:tripartite tricarboxylate transporter substrate binding protein [Steroidobacteraceae bacterium]
MELARREFLHLAAAAAASSAMPRLAWAQPYPVRPVRLIVTTPAGSSPDIVARVIAQRLSERFGRPFIVDNRPGAGSTIGTEVAVRAAPDGYTLLMALSANAIGASLYDNLKFNFIRDMAPVASIARASLVMVTNPSVPARTVPEFISYAKASPGTINMASGGNGSPTHVSGELFKMMAGINLLHVPYRGSTPALTDLLSGQVQILFTTLPETVGYITDGKLRALAVTAARRQAILPNVPTVGEFLPGYEASGWYGVVAPSVTPADIIDKLNDEINTALADPKIKGQLADLGGTVFAGSPAEFGKLIAAETNKWAKVVKFAGIRAQ